MGKDGHEWEYKKRLSLQSATEKLKHKYNAQLQSNNFTQLQQTQIVSKNGMTWEGFGEFDSWNGVHRDIPHI